MIKNFKRLLKRGFEISYPYKTKINDWYGRITLRKVKDNIGNCYIIDGDFPRKEFYDIDNAIKFYINETLTSKNVGYIQKRLRDSGRLTEDDDLESPSPEIMEMFRKEQLEVNKEHAFMMVGKIPHVFESDAEKEFNALTEVNNDSELLGKLHDIVRKYSPLGLYIALVGKYDTPDNPHYSYSVPVKSLDLETIEKLKTLRDEEGIPFSHFEVSYRINGGGHKVVKINTK